MSFRPALLIAFSIVVGLQSAQAARPLQTDDAGVLAKGECEVEGAAQRLSAAGATASEANLLLGCGVGGNSQLALAAVQARAGAVRETSLAIGGKTGLWKAADQDDASALALSWQLLGSELPGGAWRHVGTGLNLLWSMPLAADYSMHANLGHARKELDRHRATTWGLGLEHAGLGTQGRWAPMVELFGNDHERPWWNLGLRLVAVPEKLFVATSYGRQFSAERPALITLSLKAVF
jgi:hypothetical protein